MTWQRCPICEGTGQVWPFVGMPVGCDVCHGQKIIDSVTGKPPKCVHRSTPLPTPEDPGINPEPTHKDFVRRSFEP